MSVRLTLREFIIRSRRVHGDKYDYSLVNLKNMFTLITIICPIHGKFSQKPSNHYYQKHGCPECGKNSYESLEVRFWESVKKLANGDCWKWKGSKDRTGYGSISNNNKTLKAHRVSYILHNEEFDAALTILHKCNNRLCVNPNHLILGDKKIKLSQQKAGKIRELYATGNFTQLELSKMFEVSSTTIANVLHRITWK